LGVALLQSKCQWALAFVLRVTTHACAVDNTVDMQTGEIVNVQLKRAWSISPTNCPA
jgi:hypothetical protein